MGSKILNFFKRLSVTKKVILCILAFLVTGYIFCLPRHLFHVPYSTVVTDRNEELLGARIASDGQWRFPPRNTTPEKIKECLITFEDKHFYHHWSYRNYKLLQYGLNREPDNLLLLNHKLKPSLLDQVLYK